MAASSSQDAAPPPEPSRHTHETATILPVSEEQAKLEDASHPVVVSRLTHGATVLLRSEAEAESEDDDLSPVSDPFNKDRFFRLRSTSSNLDKSMDRSMEVDCLSPLSPDDPWNHTASSFYNTGQGPLDRDDFFRRSSTVSEGLEIIPSEPGSSPQAAGLDLGSELNPSASRDTEPLSPKVLLRRRSSLKSSTGSDHAVKFASEGDASTSSNRSRLRRNSSTNLDWQVKAAKPRLILDQVGATSVARWSYEKKFVPKPSRISTVYASEGSSPGGLLSPGQRSPGASDLFEDESPKRRTSEASNQSSAPATPQIRPRPRRGEACPEGWFNRLVKVSGKVVSAKGLPNTDTWGKSDPYCVVKGIRSNNHLIDIHMTPAIQNSLTPQWNEEFSFACPLSWGLVEMVGLKFLVYDCDEGVMSMSGSDDFLGGADVDISELQSGRISFHELELGGAIIKKTKGRSGVFKKKKARLVVEVTVCREFERRPPPRSDMLLSSMDRYTHVARINCRIVKAKHLRNADLVGKSDPLCLVRAVDIHGEVHTLYKTRVIEDELNPVWDEEFMTSPELTQQLILLVFDVFDDDGDSDNPMSGDHLGCTFVPLMDCESTPQKRKLPLYQKQTLESKLQKDGKLMAGFSPASPSHKRQLLRSSSKLEAPSHEGGGGGGVGGLCARLRRGIHWTESSKGRSSLVIELSVKKRKVPMPHLEQLREMVDIKDDEDIEYILEDDAWNMSVFPVPEDLRAQVGVLPVQPAHFKGMDHICFVYGRVIGASALLNKDAVGKSDPYCIVEGVSNHGERTFVHRTKTIQDCLSPLWDEHFHIAVPHRAHVHRLLFSVFDSDELDAGFTKLGEDDFLGRTNVDLSYLCNGEVIYEDMPLIGGNAAKKAGGPKSSVGTGFRRQSSISVEIRVERRVKPVYEKDLNASEDVAPLTYMLSRIPPQAPSYEDPSQVGLMLPSRAPAKVLELRANHKLLALARERAPINPRWLKPWDEQGTSALVQLPPEPSAAGQQQPQQQQPQQQQPQQQQQQPQQQQQQQLDEPQRTPQKSYCDFTGVGRRAPRGTKSMSLPALHTRIGKPVATLQPDKTSSLRFLRDGSNVGSGPAAYAFARSIDATASLRFVGRTDQAEATLQLRSTGLTRTADSGLDDSTVF